MNSAFVVVHKIPGHVQLKWKSLKNSLKFYLKLAFVYSLSTRKSDKKHILIYKFSTKMPKSRNIAPVHEMVHSVWKKIQALNKLGLKMAFLDGTVESKIPQSKLNNTYYVSTLCKLS